MARFNDHPLSYSGRSHLRFVFLLGLLNLSLVAPVLGQLTHDFRLLPDPQRSVSTQEAYFSYEANAGAVIDDVVVVRNESDESQHLLLFSADTMTASRGGIAVANHSVDAPERAGVWLSLSETHVTLAPLEDRSVPFTLKLPGDLPPGEYAASIVGQRAEEQERGQEGSMGVRWVPRFAATVLVTVPGPGAARLEPILEIENLRAATGLRRQTIIADLRNSGNDGLNRAEGKLTVRKLDGLLAHETPVHLGYFLARDKLGYRIGLEPSLVSGDYDVTLSLTHPRGTVELTRRLFLGELPDIPVIRSDDPPQANGLPRWVILTIAAAAISILLLLLLLTVQSRRLARARLKTS